MDAFPRYSTCVVVERDLDAVCFDLDDTLVVERPAADAVMLETCRIAEARIGVDAAALRERVFAEARSLWRAAATIEYCLAVGISSWEGLWARFDGEAPELRKLAGWSASYRVAAWEAALRAMGVGRARGLAEILSDHFMHARARHHELLPGARSTLEKLAAGYRLALITNGSPDLQRAKIAGAGLDHCFEVVVISGEVGAGKPDPRIFGHALARLQTPAARAVMVGDNLVRDVQGAVACGMRAVWLDRAGSPQDSGGIPYTRIGSLVELPAVLGCAPA